jgi:hypothetical protein
MPFDGQNFEQRDEVLDLLRCARERVARPGGWCKDNFDISWATASGLNLESSYCAIGALPLRRTHDLYDNTGPVAYLCKELPWGYKMPWIPKWHAVMIYNDMPGRTQTEIVALFDRAIARREREAGAKG